MTRRAARIALLAVVCALVPLARAHADLHVRWPVVDHRELEYELGF